MKGLRESYHLDGGGRVVAKEGSLWVAAGPEPHPGNPGASKNTAGAQGQPGHSRVASTNGAFWLHSCKHRHTQHAAVSSELAESVRID